MKYYIAIISLLLVPVTLLAVENSEEKIKNYGDKLTVKITAQRPTLNLKISFADEELLYLPNTMVNGSIGVAYKNFSISVGTELDGSQKNEEEYGKTDYQDYLLTYYERKFGGDVFYNSYQGFFLDNPTDYGNKPGDSTAKRPDLKMKYYGLNGFYIFSDNYSLSSSFDFGERQLKSGGSILAMVSISQLMIDSQRSLVPPARETKFDKRAGYRGGQYSAISLLPGAAYTLTVNKFFITGVLFFGGGLIHKKQTSNAGDSTSTTYFGKTNARLSTGFNNDLLFGGIQVYGDFSGFSSENDTSVKFDNVQLSFYFGVRFL